MYADARTPQGLELARKRMIGNLMGSQRMGHAQGMGAPRGKSGVGIPGLTLDGLRSMAMNGLIGRGGVKQSSGMFGGSGGGPQHVDFGGIAQGFPPKPPGPGPGAGYASGAAGGGHQMTPYEGGFNPQLSVVTPYGVMTQAQADAMGLSYQPYQGGIRQPTPPAPSYGSGWGWAQ